MKNQNLKIACVVIIVLVVAVTVLFYNPHQDQQGMNKQESAVAQLESKLNEKNNADGSVGVAHQKLESKKRAALESNSDKAKATTTFTINDKIELPFIGVVPCHSQEEQVEFEGNGKRLKWPFKLSYIANGMFVRAEFTKPDAVYFDDKTSDQDKLVSRIIYQAKPKNLESDYKVLHEKLLGFPEKAAPTSINSVLKTIYNIESFDNATKIDITWVLRKGPDDEIHPCFIANIYGVSAGILLGSVPADDESFKRYRILISPEGDALQQDNLL